MKYKFLIKKSAVKKVNTFLEIETESQILDFTMRDNVIFFICKNSIGLIENGKVIKRWSGEADIVSGSQISVGSLGSSLYYNLSSIMYSKYSDCLYTVEYGGRVLRKIDVKAKYAELVVRGINETQINYLFSKSEDIGNTDVDVAVNGAVYWVSDLIHKCFVHQNGHLTTIIGTGRPGYSICSSVQNSQLSYPNGILLYDNKLYICDSMNGVIRSLSNNEMNIIADNLKNPRKIRLGDNRLLFVDDTGVRTISTDGKLFSSEIYKSENVVTMCNNKSDIYILERIS